MTILEGYVARMKWTRHFTGLYSDKLIGGKQYTLVYCQISAEIVRNRYFEQDSNWQNKSSAYYHGNQILVSM